MPVEQDVDDALDLVIRIGSAAYPVFMREWRADGGARGWRSYRWEDALSVADCDEAIAAWLETTKARGQDRWYWRIDEIARLGSEASRDALVDLLDDTEFSEEAATWLCRLGDARGVAPLMHIMASEKRATYPDVVALSSVSGPLADAPWLEKTHYGLWRAMQGDEEAIAALRVSLGEDPDDLAAAVILWQEGDRSGARTIAKSLAEDDNRGFLLSLAFDDDVPMSVLSGVIEAGRAGRVAEAADALVRCGAAGVPGLVEIMLAHDRNIANDSYHRPYLRVIRRAVRRLGAEARTPLREIVGAGTPKRRALALALLGEVGEEQDVDLLAEALREPSHSVGIRAAAASGLGLLGGEVALGALIDALDDPSPKVVFMVARSLGYIGDPRAVEPLIEQLRCRVPGRGWNVHYQYQQNPQFAIVEALGWIGDERAIVPILEWTDPSGGVAAEALAAIGEPVLSYFEDYSLSPRAVRAASWIGGPAAEGMLLRWAEEALAGNPDRIKLERLRTALMRFPEQESGDLLALLDSRLEDIGTSSIGSPLPPF